MDWGEFHKEVEKDLGSYEACTEPGYSFLRLLFRNCIIKRIPINSKEAKAATESYRRKYFND